MTRLALRLRRSATSATRRVRRPVASISSTVAASISSRRTSALFLAMSPLSLLYGQSRTFGPASGQLDLGGRADHGQCLRFGQQPTGHVADLVCGDRADPLDEVQGRFERQTEDL